MLLLALGSATAFAQSGEQSPKPEPVATPAQTLDALGAQLASVQAALKRKNNDVPLADLRGQALAVQDQARQLAAGLAPQMAALQAQLDVLGPVPAKGAPAESSEVATQRRQLDKVQAALDAQIKQAQLLNQNAGQVAAQIAAQRNDEFQARLTSRTATPFSRAFWIDPLRALPEDTQRVRRLGAHVRAALGDAWQPPQRQPLIWCLLGAGLLLVVGRWALDRLLLWVAARQMPDGHLRRSALAAGVALSSVLIAGLAVQLLRLGLDWNDTLDDELDALAARVVSLVLFAAYVTGLGRALLSVDRPTWRLPALSDLTARRLRLFPWLLGAAALVFGLFDRLTRALGTSLAVTVVTHALVALVVSSLIGATLVRLRHARRALITEGKPPVPQAAWVGVLRAGATLGVIISWLGVATGFIALAYFVALQMLWIGVIVATLYVLSHLVHDLFHTVLAPDCPSGKRLQATFGVGANTLDQAAVVLSGVARLALLLLALAIVLSPFGAGPRELLASVTQSLGNIQLGNLPIKPGTILSALAVLVVGLLLVRGFKGWLGTQLLPRTSMTAGMQSSLVTLVGYVAGLLVVVLTLAEMQVDLKSITWIVSALTVGIGFGLQAIVQNFISGLILLVERPVKVGDWVSLSTDVEGDIQRINVRATEIRMGDRSTVIVPNSQLITENVRNVTLANAQGRVLIKLPMPLDTDAAKVRALVLEVLHEHPGTLDTPAPAVTLDNIDANSLTFACTAYVNSPRDVGGVKSALLFEILDRLRDAHLPLTRAQNMVVRSLPPLAEDVDAQG